MEKKLQEMMLLLIQKKKKSRRNLTVMPKKKMTTNTLFKVPEHKMQYKQQKNAEALNSFMERHVLAGKSHYPLYQIKIPRDNLEMVDRELSNIGCGYTVRSSYCGRGNCGPQMMLGVRREDVNTLDNILNIFEKEYESADRS